VSYLCRKVGQKNPRLSAVLSYLFDLPYHFWKIRVGSGTVQRVKATAIHSLSLKIKLRRFRNAGIN
jgi:hypothetical protein